MAADPDEFYARVRAAADADGRLPLPDMAGWNTMPYDLDGLRTRCVRRPVTARAAAAVRVRTGVWCLR